MRKAFIIIYVVLILALIKICLTIPYKNYYNLGNDLYIKQDYNKAIENYEKSLKFFPKKYDECNIRINLTLAKIQTIDFSNNKIENKDNIINALKNAKDVLCKKKCDEHNKTAEKLRKEIEELIKELEEREIIENEREEPDDEEKQEDKKNNQTIKDKLKEIQKEGQKERNEKEEYYNNMGSYEYYSGKNW